MDVRIIEILGCFHQSDTLGHLFLPSTVHISIGSVSWASRFESHPQDIVFRISSKVLNFMILYIF